MDKEASSLLKGSERDVVGYMVKKVKIVSRESKRLRRLEAL